MAQWLARMVKDEAHLTLVYLTTCSPSQLGAELTLAGYRVFEALAMSEVLFLQANEEIDAVIIGANVPDQQAKASQFRGIVISLKPHATAADLRCELSLLFSRAHAVQ
jgi:hypothetical protein